MTICLIILILILLSALFYLILYALQEHENKLKMQTDMNLLQQEIKEDNVTKEFVKAEKKAIENKVDILQKQIANLKEQLKNARQNVKRRKKQLRHPKN